MEISNTEPSTRDVHGEEGLGTAGEVLDVAVSTVLRAPRDCACTFSTDLLCKLWGCRTGVDVSWFGEEGDIACASEGRGFNEF
jgi:hypothetical protein